jgi:class 3 adenylate cyclase
MHRVHVRSFSDPDEVRAIESNRAELLSLGGLTVSHEVAQPGWRWSIHVKPIVGTEWCEIRHIGVVIRGRCHVLLQDGTEFECGPLDLFDIPAGHDAWVAGDEPLEAFNWTGAKTWLDPLQPLADRIVATLVLTDVVDSTGVAVRIGERVFTDLVASLETRSREAVDRYRGRIVKTTGDGLLATFDGAARAVRCAIALRATAADLGLPIRAAVHTGEIELADDDIRGLAIHEASRMLAVAGAGDIVVSATTADLSRDSGLVLEDRGEHELRGLPGTRHLFAVSS